MMLAAIVKKKRISKGFTDDLCSTTVQVDLIVRNHMKKSLKEGGSPTKKLHF